VGILRAADCGEIAFAAAAQNDYSSVSSSEIAKKKRIALNLPSALLVSFAES
jgi:hypothetical protein